MAKWSEDEILKLKSAVDCSESPMQAAIKLSAQIGRSIESCRHKIRSMGLEEQQGLTTDEKSQLVKLRNEISSLKSELKDAYKMAHTDEKLVEIIQEIKGRKFNIIPSWTVPKKASVTHGIPTIKCSDWHFDEFVYENQINGMNKFDHQIATDRVNHLFKTAVNIFMNAFAKPSYEGIHICFNGDICNGNIHEELRETNCQPILKTVYDLSNLITQNIKNVRKVFDNVFVTWTVGNHGRIDKKPRSKNRVFDNYEWIVGQFIAKNFADDPNVTFLIPDSSEVTFEIYNKRFLQTHGDVFRGGNGIGGILVPILRGFAKKSQNYSAAHLPIDVMLIGHFHQYIHLSNVVVNGSLKGFDEYSMQMGFPYEKPIQAAWINHPEYGMIHRTPIVCDSYEAKNEKR